MNSAQIGIFNILSYKLTKPKHNKQNSNKIKCSHLSLKEFVVLHMSAMLFNCSETLFNFVVSRDWHFEHFKWVKKCEAKTHSYVKNKDLSESEIQSDDLCKLVVCKLGDACHHRLAIMCVLHIFISVRFKYTTPSKTNKSL